MSFACEHDVRSTAQGPLGGTRAPIGFNCADQTPDPGMKSCECGPQTVPSSSTDRRPLWGAYSTTPPMGDGVGTRRASGAASRYRSAPRAAVGPRRGRFGRPGRCGHGVERRRTGRSPQPPPGKGRRGGCRQRGRPAGRAATAADARAPTPRRTPRGGAVAPAAVAAATALCSSSGVEP